MQACSLIICILLICIKKDKENIESRFSASLSIQLYFSSLVLLVLSHRGTDTLLLEPQYTSLFYFATMLPFLLLPVNKILYSFANSKRLYQIDGLFANTFGRVCLDINWVDLTILYLPSIPSDSGLLSQYRAWFPN